MFAALVLNLLMSSAHAAPTVGEIFQRNPALSKYLTATEEAAELECLPYMSDIPGIQKFDETGAPQIWHITIPCHPRGAVGVEAEVLDMSFYLRDNKPVLLTSELRTVPH